MATHAGRPVRTTSSLLDNIGNTPLIRLARVTRDLPGIEIYGKAEYFNPGGSVKDRPAARMIAEGERSGALTAGKILIDSTSGNTGIAYAMIAAAKGIPVRLCLPRNASEERKRILKAYGAEIVFTDPGEGSDGAIRKCREIYNADPDRYFYPDQYNNPANWQAHFDTTGPEILEQTDGRITHFVAALGTSGTFMGTTRYLRQRKAFGGVHFGATGVGLSRPGRAEIYADGDCSGDLRPLAGGPQLVAGDRGCAHAW